MKRAALALVAAVALAGCAVQRPPRYVRAMAAGDRAWSAGRDREAASAYEHAADETHRPLDHDEAVYRAAQAYRRAGDADAALARFDWLAEHGTAQARGPRAAFEAARLRMERGDVERAEAGFDALIGRYPTTGPARRGMALVLDERDERDPTGAQALAWLDATARRVTAPELVAAIQFERAQRLERLERYDEAAAAYDAMLAVPFPGNVRWDDGGLAYARMLLERGRPRDALAVADRVLGVREGVVMVPGSYERPRFAALAMLRGRIFAEGLHDYRAAADAYHAVYATFPTSLLRDDALEAEAEAREQAGQRAEACAVWSTLGREFPCTRRGREGAERAAACGSPVSADAANGCRHGPRHEGDGRPRG